MPGWPLATVEPDMRPKVEVRQVPYSDKHVAWCSEPECAWVYVNGVKSDVQCQATHHRAQHRRENERTTPA